MIDTMDVDGEEFMGEPRSLISLPDNDQDTCLCDKEMGRQHPEPSKGVDCRKHWKASHVSHHGDSDLRQESCSPATVVMDHGRSSFSLESPTTFNISMSDSKFRFQPLLGLPEDCFAHVLRYLGASNLGMAAAVNRQLCHLSGCDNLWRQLCLSDYGVNSDLIFKAAIEAAESDGCVALSMKQVYRKMLGFELQLRFSQGPRQGDVIRVKRGQTTGIGRSRQNDICILQDEMVSRKHAQLFITDSKGEQGKFFIRDLGSINGTYINQKQIEKDEDTPVTLQDEVEMGNSVFTVEVVVPTKQQDEDADGMSEPDTQNNSMDSDA